ncbi:MAG: tRNA (guanosine(46)-N7)-methyltransferase TrmB [Clostridia bacterium]|nr:tRNA (guanosine(46)-N7)-methyltransferase TrmB [Clostridia bacterium]MBO7398297.1 tRNA (guanosine(46)-N7)-methyltransferase TrmB [Clostridia bacterium]MBO7503644.1 tRNA (guanosine(46)-N7)-methyltransferase TrmB [Clostridia bacterium]MBO7659338.1 tRNA (guanosine(46)-N7)-methyltransferase TrmB [Clostridia bacterium]MBP5665763.1 tRNA (guanosine(46)-N7)-methyltransferase TrmB [Clostridia bacterium]
MRPRNKKNLEKRLSAGAEVLEQNPESKKGAWKGEYKSLRVEIGCGKGAFLCGMAEKEPDVMFVGIESVKNVIVTATEKVREKGLGNVRFICANALFMGDFFAEGEIETIYLNFSDPWPRDRYHKNRLTGENFLPLYVKLLRDGGHIVQKTDNTDLFDFSLESYAANGCVVNALSRDLHNEPWYAETGNVVTEYEERFTGMGVPICYADVTVPPRGEVADKIRACEERIAIRKKYETEAAAERRERAKKKRGE